MDLRKIKSAVKLNYCNLQGWHTDRKIIVIESDDWGSIRMPSKAVYEKMLIAGIRVDNCPYNRFDSLENESDLEALFDILRKFTDINGKHPVITTNFVMANPDFQKIKDSEYQEYKYELFTDTLQRYPNHKNTFKSLAKGIAEKLVYPQYHGREHLNVNRWMKALKSNLPETKLAFENELFGLSTTITREKRRSYLAAFDFDHPNEIEDHRAIIIDGLRLFQKIFGYKPETFIAANYVWHRSLENTLAENGVNFIQGSFVQIEPLGSYHPSRLIPRRLGRSNESGQIYLTRNVSFEPSLVNNVDPVANSIKDIAIAFRWKKPAIISSHRLNYIGSIVRENRDNNLKFLNNLLEQITKRWNNIEYMNSAQLGSFIKSDILR